MTLAPWMSPAAQARLAETAALATGPAADVAARLHAAAARNRAIHDADCFNLDPAANVMTPAAEAMLSAGLGSRPSLGWPGEKYETGLEAIEEVEGIATALAAQVFRARHAETRVGRGRWPTFTPSWRWRSLATPSSRPPAASGAMSPTTPRGVPGFTGCTPTPPR